MPPTERAAQSTNKRTPAEEISAALNSLHAACYEGSRSTCKFCGEACANRSSAAHMSSCPVGRYERALTVRDTTDAVQA